MNVFIESAAKNTQDNLLRSYSFSAIPKTSLLGNQYLHDKRTASNTRRKPSRGTQGLLASKVDDPQVSILLLMFLSSEVLIFFLIIIEKGKLQP